MSAWAFVERLMWASVGNILAAFVVVLSIWVGGSALGLVLDVPGPRVDGLRTVWYVAVLAFYFGDLLRIYREQTQ